MTKASESTTDIVNLPNLDLNLSQTKSKSKKKSSNSLFGAAFNIANGTVGAGILGLPLICKECGLLPGLLFIIFGFLICDCTYLFLHYASVYARKKSPKKLATYEQVGRWCFGRTGSNIVKISMILICMGALISYTVVFGSLLSITLTGFFGEHYFFTRIPTTIIVLIPVLLMCMIKKVSNMQILSYCSMGSILIFSIFVIIGYATDMTVNERKGEFELAKSNLFMLRVLGIVVFSYAGHFNLVNISSEFTSENQYKIPWAIQISQGLCTLVYTLVATFGYLSFYEATQDSIIDSYGTGWITAVFRLLLLVSIIFTYPLLMFGARSSIIHLMNQLRKFYQKKIKKKIKKEDSAPSAVTDEYKGLPTSESLLQLVPNISPQPIKHENSIQNFQNSTEMKTSESQLQLNSNMISPEISPSTSMTELRDVQLDIGKKVEATIIETNTSTPNETRIHSLESVSTGKNKWKKLFTIENFRFVVVTLAVGVICFAIAVSVPFIGIILSLTGSTAASFIALILPPAFYIKACDYKYTNWRVILAFIFLIFGIIFGVTVTTISIIDLF